MLMHTQALWAASPGMDSAPGPMQSLREVHAISPTSGVYSSKLLMGACSKASKRKDHP